MRVRVCGHENVYWVEVKEWALARWRKAPSILHWLELHSIRWYPEYVRYYDTYEQARDVASEYLRRFGKRISVVQEIER